MMLTILGLPRNTKYHDLKVLIKQECKIGDFILDNLLSDEDGSKKVRIGLTDEREGVHLIKCLDGYRMSGNILRVVPVGKQSQPGPQQNLDMRGGYNQHPMNQPGPDYNHPMNPMQGKHSPWMQNTNQWTPNQNMGNQPVPSHSSNTFGVSNYQPQNQVSNTPFMQQQGPQQQRPDPKFGQRELYGEGRISTQGPGYGFPPKNNMPENTNFYHGNTQYNMVHSQPNQNLGQYQVQSHQGQSQPSAWLQQVHQQKQPIFSAQSKVSPTSFNKRDFNDVRKFPEPSKTSTISKASQDHDNYKNYNKSGRFSPQPSKHQHRMDSPPGKRISPSGRRISPSGRRILPSGPPGRRGPSPGRRLSPPGRRMSPSERRLSPPGRRLSPSGRRISPSGRRISPSGRRISPSGRRISPSGRRNTPPGRRISPAGRRISPPGRRISPSGHRVSPSGHRLSPSGHRNSPPGRDDRRIPIRHSPGRRDSPRRHSPHRNLSPNRRPGSPDWRSSGRRSSPQMHSSLRYSPSRHHPDKRADKYGGHDSQGSSKLVTPAYDSAIKAPNQQIYTGGYRPNLHEKVQYPIPGPRKGEASTSSWKDKEKISFSITGKKEEDRRDISRMQSFEIPRGTDLRVDRMDSAIEAKRGHSPSRKSRSPMRRERSPLRDRYRRHSPSPRSPRRSWALEKRRSPDIREAPPPPIWPGQNRETEEYARTNRPGFNRPDMGDKPKHISVWESVPFKEKDDHRDARRSEEKQRFQPLGRSRSDLPSTSTSRREPSPRGHFKPVDERFPQREQKGSPRDDFDRRGTDFRRSDDVERKYGKDFRDMPQRVGDNVDRHRQDFQREEYNLPEEERRREGYRKGSEELSKEIEDIHRRAIEFRKKAEEHRRNEERRKGYSEEKERHDPADRLSMKHYNDRSKNIFSEDDRRREEISNEYRRLESDDRLRQNDRPFSRHSDEHKKESEPKWTVDEMIKKPMAATIKSKRDNAAKEIAQKIFKRKNLPTDGDHNRRVFEELKRTLWRNLYSMFGDDDVSFIELVIKFNAKYGEEGEDKMFNDVMSSFSNKMRKRQASEGLDFTGKIPRGTPEGDMKKDIMLKEMTTIQMPSWDLKLTDSGNTASMLMMHSQYHQSMSTMPLMVNTPMMVPMPTFAPSFEEVQATPQVPTFEEISQQYSYRDVQDNAGNYQLYLCKDDFEPFTDIQADYLKQYIINQLRDVTEVSQGWAPDITLKGLQSVHRYEVLTEDKSSSDWLLSIDFSGFPFFNVLVYTKEELWYERAAIWLPGHSRSRKIEPLDKLKLQNKKLKDVDIGKWKLVKKVITLKGIRIYVDMPPASARALEKHNMKVSYELQKVSVFLKAVAVDKDAFEAGLKEMSITDESEILKAVVNSPMPSLPQDPNIVKIALKGNKTFTITQARKIKEMIIYRIFKYHQENGTHRTDFVKFGFCSPGYFGLLPENDESKQWITDLQLGNLNRHPIIIFGFDNRNTKYIRMTISVNYENNLNQAVVQERLKHCNQGVKGINFHLWKPVNFIRGNKAHYEVEIDLESIEKIAKMKYQLDYVHNKTASVKYKDGTKALENLIKKYKAELEDTCDVADMDLALSDDEDIVCLE